MSLAAEMRKRGFMISKCVKCGKSNIEDILNNPIYIGDFIFKGKRYYNAKHDPIVNREIYAVCQKIIAEHTSFRPNKKDFLFTSMIKCSKCNCTFTAEIKKGRYVYYHCTGRRGGDCKRRTYLKEKHAEEIFLNVLKRLQLSDEGMEIVQEQVREQVKRQTEINADRIQEVQKRINLINARLNKMFDMFLDGELEETFYNKKRGEFQYEIDLLNTQLTNLNNSTIDILEFSRKTLELFKKTPLLYLNGDIETKRELIKLACSNLLYDGENLTIIIKKAFQPLVNIANFKMVEHSERQSNFFSALLLRYKKRKTVCLLLCSIILKITPVNVLSFTFFLDLIMPYF